MGLGFLAALLPAILEEAKTGVNPPVGTSISDFLANLGGWLITGAIFGAAQAFVLRTTEIPVKKWIFATSCGFGIGAIVLDWPLQALELLGNIPGPVEPIVMTNGGGILAGVMQYFVLRSESISAERWILFWIVGLFLSLIPAALFFIVVFDVLSIELPWAIEVFVQGFIVAGVATLFSATQLRHAIE